jgi:DNA-binding NarL/FixJ family response regulator
VLIVEDEPNLTRIYRKHLDRAGYRVVVARSLATARELMAESERVFDVAVIDVRLPDGDGDELIGPLLDRAPLCMSLVVTGLADPHLQRRLARLGAHASLLKPVLPNILVEAVTTALSATRAWRNLAEETDQARAKSRRPVPRVSQTHSAKPYAIDVDRAIERLSALGELSPTQSEVARYMLLGLADRDISEALQMRLRTVKYHVSQVIQRTGANGRAGLVAVLLADAG